MILSLGPERVELGRLALGAARADAAGPPTALHVGGPGRNSQPRSASNCDASAGSSAPPSCLACSDSVSSGSLASRLGLMQRRAAGWLSRARPSAAPRRPRRSPKSAPSLLCNNAGRPVCQFVDRAPGSSSCTPALSWHRNTWISSTKPPGAAEPANLPGQLLDRANNASAERRLQSLSSRPLVWPLLAGLTLSGALAPTWSAFATSQCLGRRGHSSQLDLQLELDSERARERASHLATSAHQACCAEPAPTQSTNPSPGRALCGATSACQGREEALSPPPLLGQLLSVSAFERSSFPALELASQPASQPGDLAGIAASRSPIRISDGQFASDSQPTDTHT